MDRLKDSDILKPGAKLEPVLVDVNDPEVRALFALTRKRQEEIMAMKPENWTREMWQNLNLIITI